MDEAEDPGDRGRHGNQQLRLRRSRLKLTDQAPGGSAYQRSSRRIGSRTSHAFPDMGSVVGAAEGEIFFTGLVPAQPCHRVDTLRGSAVPRW